MRRDERVRYVKKSPPPARARQCKPSSRLSFGPLHAFSPREGSFSSTPPRQLHPAVWKFGRLNLPARGGEWCVASEYAFFLYVAAKKKVGSSLPYSGLPQSGLNC